MIRLTELKVSLADVPVEHRRAADAPAETEADRGPPPHPPGAHLGLAPLFGALRFPARAAPGRGAGDLLTALQRISAQAERAGKVIRSVHDFVRRSEPKLAPLDLNAVVRDAVGLIEADARKRQVQLRVELAAPLPQVEADAVMIEQIVVNLVRNAMDSMRDTAPPEHDVTVCTAREGRFVTVTVADRGAGIPAETSARLFEPFFTTKQEGMGMGLNICRSIVEFHNGRLLVDANPEGGTIFSFTLPTETASERNARSP